MMERPDEQFPIRKLFRRHQCAGRPPVMPGEKPYIDRPSAPVEPKELLLYLGCNVLRTAHLAKTVIDVLRQMGFDFNAAGGPAHCCGIIHHINGEPAQAQTIAANSMRHFARYGAQHVLMWCPSCHEQYDEVITQQQNVAFGYEHVTSFIARHLDRIPFVRRVEKRVALHYHTGHVQADRDWQHTRAILQAIPGLDLVHIDNPAALGRHCTPRWIGRVGRPTWQRTIADILDAAKGAGCDTVASIYHSCHREICVQAPSVPPARTDDRYTASRLAFAQQDTVNPETVQPCFLNDDNREGFSSPSARLLPELRKARQQRSDIPGRHAVL